MHHHIRLPKEASRVAQVLVIVEKFLLYPPNIMDPYTDASGLHGWGAYWDGRWISTQWPAEHISNDITWKEFYAIVTTVKKLGHSGNARKYFSIVIVGQYVKYGKRHPPNILRSWP